MEVLLQHFQLLKYEDIKNDMKLKSRFDKILFPVLKDMREELKVEHEEKIKEERKRAREEEMKKGHKRKKK